MCIEFREPQYCQHSVDTNVTKLLQCFKWAQLEGRRLILRLMFKQYLNLGKLAGDFSDMGIEIIGYYAD